jgi:hypothetical protein
MEENICESSYETIWITVLISYKGLLIVNLDFYLCTVLFY